jgi:hypothetical protein
MRRQSIVLAVPAAALLLSAGGISAHAANQIGTTSVYVSTTGSDTNPCTKALPCATMQYAVDNAPNGAVIHVEAGTYNQTVNITTPVTLAGAGASKTIINGSNIDTGAMGYYGVVSVENNTGAGGPINIRGMTVEGAYVSADEYAEDEDPIDVTIYQDQNSADTITVSGMVLGPVQDTADYGGVGFYTFGNAAPVSFTNSTSKGNNQGALLEGGGAGGTGGGVTVSGVTFKNLVNCVGNCSGSPTVYPGDGVFVLSDEAGTATNNISHNTFSGYAGFGIAVDAGYSSSNCSGPNGPCPGNVSLTANNNAFTLGACSSASQDCAAISLDAEAGNELSAQIKANTGSVRRPDKAIVEQTDSGVYNVTEINNRVKVLA